MRAALPALLQRLSTDAPADATTVVAVAEALEPASTRLGESERAVAHAAEAYLARHGRILGQVVLEALAPLARLGGDVGAEARILCAASGVDLPRSRAAVTDDGRAHRLARRLVEGLASPTAAALEPLLRATEGLADGDDAEVVAALLTSHEDCDEELVELVLATDWFHLVPLLRRPDLALLRHAVAWSRDVTPEVAEALADDPVSRLVLQVDRQPAAPSVRRRPVTWPARFRERARVADPLARLRRPRLDTALEEMLVDLGERGQAVVAAAGDPASRELLVAEVRWHSDAIDYLREAEEAQRRLACVALEQEPGGPRALRSLLFQDDPRLRAALGLHGARLTGGDVLLARLAGDMSPIVRSAALAALGRKPEHEPSPAWLWHVPGPTQRRARALCGQARARGLAAVEPALQALTPGPELWALLDDASPVLRREAARHAARRGALEHLRWRLRGERDPDVVAEVVLGLQGDGPSVATRLALLARGEAEIVAAAAASLAGEPRARPLLAALLDHPEPRVAAACRGALESEPPVADVETVLDGVPLEDLPECQPALRLLRGEPPGSDGEALLRFLEHPTLVEEAADPGLARSIYGWCLARLGTPHRLRAMRRPRVFGEVRRELVLAGDVVVLLRRDELLVHGGPRLLHGDNAAQAAHVASFVVPRAPLRFWLVAEEGGFDGVRLPALGRERLRFEESCVGFRVGPDATGSN